MPDEPEVMGLLALLLLVQSRRAARTGTDEDLVLLADQDRALWDRDLIAEGQAIVRACLRRNQPGPVPGPGRDQRRAQRRRHAADTDWRQILAALRPALALAPTPVAALNRAVAVAEVEGPPAPRSTS